MLVQQRVNDIEQPGETTLSIPQEQYNPECHRKFQSSGQQTSSPCTCQNQRACSDRLHPTGCCQALNLCSKHKKPAQHYQYEYTVLPISKSGYLDIENAFISILLFFNFYTILLCLFSIHFFYFIFN